MQSSCVLVLEFGSVGVSVLVCVQLLLAGWHQTAVRAQVVIDESIDSSWLGSVREKDAGGRLIG